jgi:hypothetical protein
LEGIWFVATSAKFGPQKEKKHQSPTEQAYFGFSSSNFTVQDHILSTVGDALTRPVYQALNLFFGGYI